jgi:ABC-type transport system involved in Fe-S cluster assembly fused permease/ATPase subunit
MQAQRNDRRGNLTLAIVAAFIAVVGQAVVLFNDFGAGNNLRNSVSARMITAAALSRAGAIEILPKPAAGRPAS